MKVQARREFMEIARKAKGHTYKSLAEAIGSSAQHLNNIEKGEKNPSGRLACLIAKELEIDVTLFFTSNVPEKNTKRTKTA